jgi:hypothetical protein
MIRPFTCICMLLAAGSGLYLYQTKHRAQMLDRTIAQTLRQIDQTKDRIGVLKGEWALLNEPERLQDLAQQHLALKTLAPTQFAALADLGNRLPAPLPPGTVTLPAEDAPQPVPPPTPAAVPIAAAKPAATVAQPAARAFATNDRPPEKTPERPSEKLAERIAEKPAVPAPPAARPAPRPASLVASAVSPAAARPLPPPVPVAQPPSSNVMAPHFMAPVMNVSAQEMSHPLAPGTVGEAVARANRKRGGAPVIVPASSMAEQTYTPPAASASPYTPSPYAAAGTVSALGGAGRLALPAPVPYGTAQARP